MDRIERLIARSEISDLLCRYARGIDRRDWDAVRACFHPDATDEHGDFSGNPENFIAWVSARHAAVPYSMHFLGNCLVEFAGDGAAAVETYFIAMQRRERTGAAGAIEGTDYEVFGRYVDRFEQREDGVWRIAVRRVVYDSTRTLPSSNHLRQLAGIFGRRDSGDPVFANLLAAE